MKEGGDKETGKGGERETQTETEAQICKEGMIPGNDLLYNPVQSCPRPLV